MKRVILAILLTAVVFGVTGQAKQGKRVKRKYRQTEQENRELPPVLVHGRVHNADSEVLAGASVVVRGTRIGVSTNEEGEYFMKGLTTGIISIQASFVGYRTKIIDYQLREGNNDIYFTLDREEVALEPVTVTSQQREQQLLEIPSGITAVSSSMMTANNIRELSQLAEFVPGLTVREQTPHRPNYVIRGLTSDEVSLSAQPRVSVYYNNTPVSRPSLASAELYDMERVEVLRGPQGTLFGRGAQAGVIHYVTKKAVAGSQGYLSAGAGEYGMQEYQGAVNGTVLPGKLFARVSGIYTTREGYVKNSFGGTLNGENTLGARVSLRYLPFWNTRVDLVVNYQQDDYPGTAFMSKQLPNTNGSTDIFQYEASLEQGKNLGNYRDISGTSLEIKRFRNENNYLSSTTSYMTNYADSRWDGDGTAAPAIDMAEKIDIRQFNQELRYNFSLRSRINGFAGVSYWRERAKQNYWFCPDEQYISYLLMGIPQLMVNSEGTPVPMTALPPDPQLGPLGGLALPASHSEENLSGALNQAIDAFADATWRMTERLHLTGGIRGTYERFKLTNESRMTGETPSTLGMLTGMSPNLFFRPAAKSEAKTSGIALTYRAVLKYDLNENANFFAGYAKGRRPNVIQFNSAGEREIMNQETLNNFDAGFKTSVAQRLWADVTTFYQLFSDFQTNAWVGNTYLVRDAGKATSYGVEGSLKIALLKNIDLFGNYAWIHARFDSIDSQGNAQEFAGNTFRLTPEHSYTAGINAKVKLYKGFRLFAVPSWSWKSHVWFEDANTAGLEQKAFGMVNATAGFMLENPSVILSVTGSNLLDEKYLISVGNTGAMFGIPTFIPGAPRMLGAKITWTF